MISCCNVLFLLGHFFLINPQLTSLYSNFSYGSKKGPAKYFWDTKSGGAVFEISPPSSESGEGLVPAHPGCPGQSPESCKMIVCVVIRAVVAEPLVHEPVAGAGRRIASSTQRQQQVDQSTAGARGPDGTRPSPQGRSRERRLAISAFGSCLLTLQCTKVSKW